MASGASGLSEGVPTHVAQQGLVNVAFTRSATSIGQSGSSARMAAPPPSVAEMLSSAADLSSFVSTCLTLASCDPETDLFGQEGHTAAICVGLAAHRASAEAQAAGLKALKFLHQKSTEPPPSNGVYDGIWAAMRAHPKQAEVQDVGIQARERGGESTLLSAVSWPEDGRCYKVHGPSPRAHRVPLC